MLYPTINREQYAEKPSTTFVCLKPVLLIIRIESHKIFFVAENNDCFSIIIRSKYSQAHKLTNILITNIIYVQYIKMWLYFDPINQFTGIDRIMPVSLKSGKCLSVFINKFSAS